MTSLTVKARETEWNKQTMKLIDSFGYKNVTPNAEGEYIDIIADTSRIYGYDLITHDSIRNAYTIINTHNHNKIKDWLLKHVEVNA